MLAVAFALLLAILAYAYAPQGVNAIEYAAKLIGRLGEIGTRLAAPERHDPRFDPPYSTVQTGVISGRYLSFRIDMSATYPARFKTLVFDVQPLGQY